MRRQFVTVVAALGLLLAACGAADTGTVAPALDGAWQLESGTVRNETIPIVDDYRITFTSEDTTFGGRAACNTYGGSLGGTPLFGDVFVTEMACLPEVMDSEQAYLSALGLVDTIDRDGPVLLLSGADAALRFILLPPVPEEALIGTMWVLETLVDGETASSVVGERATLAFHSDGMFVASTGCRTLTGTYVAVGDQIETPQLSADGECSADLETQDGHVVEVFEGGYTVDINGDRLTLTAAGNHSLVYRSSGAGDR